MSSTIPCDGSFRIMAGEAGSTTRAQKQAMGRTGHVHSGHRCTDSYRGMANPFSCSAMDVHQAALFLGCKSGLVRKLAAEGTLPHYRIGRLLRFRREDLEAFIASQSTPPRDNFQTEKSRKGGDARRNVAQKEQTTKQEEKRRESPPTKQEIEKLWR
jgi:excisionase family DNA binding protein